jgi:hypothetical protein
MHWADSGSLPGNLRKVAGSMGGGSRRHPGVDRGRGQFPGRWRSLLASASRSPGSARDQPQGGNTSASASGC